MWHILKVAYTAPDAPSGTSKLLGFGSLEEAKRIFSHLELGYQLDSPVRVKGGKKVTLSGVWLYESFKDNYNDAVAAVNAGNATLMQQAREIEIDLS